MKDKSEKKSSELEQKIDNHAKRQKSKYLGWAVGVTYMSGKPGGLDYGYFMRLLDEMAENKMNILSLHMQSYAYYDPDHDGYCWPVQNPKLKCYQDNTAINAKKSEEFISKVISAAEDRGIEVDLFLNWGIWNPEKIKVGYPDAVLQKNREGKSRGWLHCPDSPGAGLDEVEDLLSFYNHPNVKSYSFERVSYEGSSY